MIEMLKDNAIRLLIGLAVLLAVVGLFFRADEGVEATPLMYPLVGIIVVAVVVMVVRLLAPVLKTRQGDDHAD